MKCQKCGFKVPEDAAFCSICGNTATAETENQNSEAAVNPVPKKKKSLALIFGCVAAGIVLLVLIAILCVLIEGRVSDDVKPNSPSDQVSEAPVDEIDFNWISEPFLAADDMTYITNYDADYQYGRYAIFYTDGKCGIIDSDGNVVCDPVYTTPEYCDIQHGIAFNNHTKVFLLDSGYLIQDPGHGGTYSMFVYDINSRSYMYVCGGDGPEKAIDFDATGCYITYECSKELDNEGYYEYKTTGRVGLYNNGQLVIPFEYKLATGISNGIIAMYDGEVWSYFDIQGNILLENVPTNGDVFQWSKKTYTENETIYSKMFTELVYEFNEGCVPVKQGDKWGYMDKNGEMIINAVFEKALPFVEKRAWVCVDGKWGIIEIK